MVKIKTSEKFEKIVDKIDGSLKIPLEKLISKLMNDPKIGKPMKFNRKGTREVYLGSFRLSYAYDEDEDLLYFLDFYHKDEQ